jgi:hypothetical protein
MSTGHGAVAFDPGGFIVTIVRTGHVGLLKPGLDNGHATTHWLVERIVQIDRVLTEEVANRRSVVGFLGTFSPSVSLFMSRFRESITKSG